MIGPVAAAPVVVGDRGGRDGARRRRRGDRGLRRGRGGRCSGLDGHGSGCRHDGGGVGSAAVVVGAMRRRRCGVGVVDVDDGDELVAPGASRGTSSIVAAGSEPGGSTSTRGAGYSSAGSPLIHASSSPFSQTWMAGNVSSTPGVSGAVNSTGKAPSCVGGQHAAGPLEDAVARAVRCGGGRPPLDGAGGGVRERGADAHGDRRRLATPVRRLEPDRGRCTRRHGDQVGLGVSQHRGRRGDADGDGDRRRDPLHRAILARFAARRRPRRPQ